LRSPRVVISGLLALITITSTTACQLNFAADDTREIVIGADLELSGPLAAVGTAYRRALELKLDQINRSGVLGNRKLRIEPVDNSSDPSLSQTNIASFVERSDVAAIITGACGECVIASSKLLNERRMPTVALAPASGVASPVAERPYIFKLGPNANDSAAALAREVKRTEPKAAALVVTDDAYGQDGRSALQSELSGIKLTTSVVRLADTDLTQAIQRALDADPDALILWLFPHQAATAAVSARNAGFEGKIYLDMGAAGDLFIAEPAAQAIEDAIMISTQTMAIDDVIATTPAKAARKQWFRDYTSRYGGYNAYASFAADALQLIVNAIETVGDIDRERIRNVLETTQIDGLSGPLRMTPDNHSGLMPQALTALVARGGRWRVSG